MRGMTFRPSTAFLTLTALVTLSGCDKPKWQDNPPPAATAAPGAAPAAAAPTVRVIPNDPAGTPAAPAWAADMIGKSLRALYPATGVCKGNTDIVQKRYAGAPAGVQLHGWGWDVKSNVRVARVLLVDTEMKIVGAGEGGVERTDVPQHVPEIKDANTGWNADLARVTGPIDAYGLLPDGKTVCPLGHIEY